ncbi:MAG: ABC transporter family substrate-binding protein [Microbacteriaceae bacterium]
MLNDNRSRGLVAALAATIAVVLTLPGCAPRVVVVEGSSVTMAIEQPVTSLNDKTSAGNSASNASIVYATNSRFFYYDDAPSLVPDESFGQVKVVSENPLTVTYTINEGLEWSDGVPIDASDLLLAWAANSGRFTTAGVKPSAFFDSIAGEYSSEPPEDTVYFDGANRSGLQLVTELPQVGDDGRSITLIYDEYFPDWELAFEVGVPAHVVARETFPSSGGSGGDGSGDGSGDGDDAQAERALAEAATAKNVVLDAIRTADVSALSALAVTWNTAFTLTDTPPNAGILVSSGPYVVSEIVPNESVTLTANPRYRGDHQPKVETIVVRTIADPLEVVAAVADGSLDIATPSASIEVVEALDDLNEVTVVRGSSGTFEHVDLQFASSKSGLFDDPLIREAFLLTVPRRAIVSELIQPVNPDATTRDSFLFAPGAAGYDSAAAANGSEKFDRVNITKAKDLVEEAGVTAPTVCVLFDPRNPRRVSEFTMIQESAALAGFTVTDCSRPDWVDFLGVAGAYDASLFGWNETNLAVSGPAARLRSDSEISNLNYFASTSVDAVLDSLELPQTVEERSALLVNLDSELWDEYYGLPLFQYPSLTVVSDRVLGVVPTPLYPGIVWNLWEWQPAEVSETPATSR